MKRKAFFSVLTKHIRSSFSNFVTIVLILVGAIYMFIASFDYIKNNTYSEEQYQQFQALTNELQTTYDKSIYKSDSNVKIVISNNNGINNIEYNLKTGNMTSLESVNKMNGEKYIYTILFSVLGGLFGYLASFILKIIYFVLATILSLIKLKIDKFKNEVNEEINQMQKS